MENDLKTLVDISRRYGSDPDFVIAGGGNTSLKEGDRMWVKASGQALAEIGPDGFVEMDLAGLRSLVDQDFGPDPDRREELFKQAIYAARTQPELGQRPSVECAVHALFPHRYVVHTHATYANMVSCCVGGRDLARELWGDQVVWVPYVDPGFTLAKEVQKVIAESDPSKPIAMVWQNHGFLVAADDPRAIDSITTSLLERVQERVNDLPETPSDPDRNRRLTQLAPAFRGALLANGSGAILHYLDSDRCRTFADRPHSRQQTELGPLIPDQIVYCKSFPLWLGCDEDPVEAIRKHIDTTGFPPKIVLVPKVGAFSVGPTRKEAMDAGAMYEDAVRLMVGAEQLGGISPMSQRDREFIDAWEVEQYRRAIAGGSKQGRMAGKTVVVTGGAKGFGLGIAEGLGKEGAHIAVWDLDADEADKAAKDVNRRFGPGRAFSVRADVASPEQVADAVAKTVAELGGVDLFVSNAGVLLAGSVKNQNPKDFELVTRVNYIGFFNCVQGIATVMSAQNANNTGSWCDIVQVNSKSGLQGSNRNGAYAGSKFGGIGLTQSFALELVEDRIKVNAICPGNFFEGPLWSDPDRGLFRQYLREGKVPGAQTMDDVKRFYESKVPMGRGCRPEDVVKAILYVVDQEYETGQAIPVTGGQVMLS